MPYNVGRVCIFCKWYEQDSGDFEQGISPWCYCRKTNNGNLKGFPFNNKLKCFEENESGIYDYDNLTFRESEERRIMNRLTERAKNGKAVYCHPTSDPKGWDGNRSAVLERCCQYEDTGLTPKEIMDGKMLTGWIPVVARLPDEPNTDTDMKEYNVTIVGATESTSLIYVGCGEWQDDNCNRYNVIAWQPLPEPYEP